MHRDTFHVGGDDGLFGYKTINFDSRINLEFLYENKKNSDHYVFFDRATGVLKVGSNKAAYFNLSYARVVDEIFKKLREAYDGISVEVHQGSREEKLADLIFWLKIEYNDPTSKSKGIFYSDRFELF